MVEVNRSVFLDFQPMPKCEGGMSSIECRLAALVYRCGSLGWIRWPVGASARKKYHLWPRVTTGHRRSDTEAGVEAIHTARCRRPCCSLTDRDKGLRHHSTEIIGNNACGRLAFICRQLGDLLYIALIHTACCRMIGLI